jgi:molybdate transport system ATP-binding protein
MSDSGIQIKLQQQQSIPLSVQLNCRAGELLSLVGPSGSGKTTILRAIAGLFHATQGSIICQGETWQDSEQKLFLPPHRRHVGLVFQNYALFPHMTVLENIQQALSDNPKHQRHIKAEALLNKVNLEGLQKRYPKTLSGGQQQRVAVARALARQPQVLLLDEPFSAVDQVTRRKLYRELLNLKQTLAIPIILVTHDLDETALLADRMALLYKGEILQAGSPEFVASHPQTATVARLMDQQNLFTAMVLAHEPTANITRLLWRDVEIEAVYQSQFTVNQQVCWSIQPSNILLHRRDRPSMGERENPLQGKIIEYLENNGLARLLVQVNRELKVNLTVNVPIHVAKRNRLALNEKIGLSLLAEGIHLMPFQQLRRDIEANPD